MLPTMEEMAEEVNLAIKTLKDGTLPDVPTQEVRRLTASAEHNSEV